MLQHSYVLQKALFCCRMYLRSVFAHSAFRSRKKGTDMKTTRFKQKKTTTVFLCSSVLQGSGTKHFVFCYIEEKVRQGGCREKMKDHQKIRTKCRVNSQWKTYRSQLLWLRKFLTYQFAGKKFCLNYSGISLLKKNSSANWCQPLMNGGGPTGLNVKCLCAILNVLVPFIFIMLAVQTTLRGGHPSVFRPQREKPTSRCPTRHFVGFLSPFITEVL